MTLNKMHIGVLIAVRMKSSRLKSKALSEIEGKPLVGHLIERMKRVQNAGQIILCTSTHKDDEVLLDIADQYGIKKYAGDELDVMKRFIKAASLNNLKHIVRVTGDNPLTDPENIDRMIERHISEKYEFTKSEYLPLGVNAEVVAVETLIKAHSMAQDPSLTEYMTSYLKRPEYFKIHTMINTDPFYENRENIRLTVDYDADMLVMRYIYGALYKINKNFSIRNVLEYLDSNETILHLNENMLETPLPKVKFKGEKTFQKKLVLIGGDINDHVRGIIAEIEKLEKYEIIGYIYFEDKHQYSLVDGIPVMGHIHNISSIKHSAEYYYIASKNLKSKNEYDEILKNNDLQEIVL
jgi:spore coat polysaccharide biosynthesis protein SpsF